MQYALVVKQLPVSCAGLCKIRAILLSYSIIFDIIKLADLTFLTYFQMAPCKILSLRQITRFLDVFLLVD